MFYVASHGPFARGLINSLSLLIGDEHGVRAGLRLRWRWYVPRAADKPSEI